MSGFLKEKPSSIEKRDEQQEKQRAESIDKFQERVADLKVKIAAHKAQLDELRERIKKETQEHKQSCREREETLGDQISAARKALAQRAKRLDEQEAELKAREKKLSEQEAALHKTITTWADKEKALAEGWVSINKAKEATDSYHRKVQAIEVELSKDRVLLHDKIVRIEKNRRERTLALDAREQGLVDRENKIKNMLRRR